MSFAVIETGGKQYRVSAESTIRIEKLPQVKEGAAVVFDKILLTDDGAKTVVGAPYIAGASVKGEVVEEGRNKKIEVIKYKAKSRYFKLRGHRQPFMKVRIASL